MISGIIDFFLAGVALVIGGLVGITVWEIFWAIIFHILEAIE